MRKTLNRKLIEANRDDVDQGGLPDNIFLEWSAYRQLHDHAADLGLAGRDDPLHDFLDERLAYFEECAWLEHEEALQCPECGALHTVYGEAKRCDVCGRKLVRYLVP